MNKIKNISRAILVIVFLMVIVVTNTVFAVTSNVIDYNLKGSVSLTVYEFVNGNESNKRVLKGAKFAIYKVSEEEQTLTQAESYITGKTALDEETSDTNGNITFSNLDLGRYFVVQTRKSKKCIY